MTCGKIDLSCAKCRLSESRTQVVPGTGSCRSKLMLIGEAPGKDEDLKGEPFVGRAGKLLDEALQEAGVHRSEVFIANLVKCRPPNNRRPRKDEVEACSEYLRSELEAVRPRVVCVLGQTAAKALLSTREKMSVAVGSMKRTTIHGKVVQLIVSYHPAACLYQRRHVTAFKKAIRKSVRAAGLGERGPKTH